MIVAVDFDGILFEDSFPGVGKPYYEMISFIRQLIDEGHEVILWTSRTGERLTEAVDACGDYGLHFCAVNGNAPSNMAKYIKEYPHPSPKVYADIYLDDRNPWFFDYLSSSNHKHENIIHVMIALTRRVMRNMENSEEQK